FSVLVNGEAQSQAALDVAREVVGPDLARVSSEPMMGSEDFADMLHIVPGAYVWLGMTPGAMVHNPAYVFDDAILPIGASLLARLAETRTLAVGASRGAR
ncbi:M20/M25/M40 family metallo-hydrolase, partial [Enterovirga sp.]|uniref:M20/M25/M40 family metallo-hydrolase n=1 Tax=Enterovirga sp. TaxID=2026350 RepID=UPI0026108733